MSETLETAPIEQPQTQAAGEQPDIQVVGMRSFGEMRENGSSAPVAEPVIVPSTENEVKTPEPALPEVHPAETNAVPQTQPVHSEPVKSPETPVQSFDKYKELGIDESQKEDFDNYLQAWKTGKLDEFVKVKNTDYDAIAPEELVRMALKADNPSATPKQLDVLHKQYLKSLGATDDADDPDTLDAMEIYNLKAETMRDALKAKKAEYKLPEYKVPDQPAPVDPQVIRQEVEQSIKADPVFNSFVTNRIVTMGSGEDSYKYEVPTSLDMMEMTANPAAFNSLFADPQGNFDMNKWVKVVNYAANMDKVEAALIDSGKNSAAKKQFESLNNPKPEVMPAAAVQGDQFQLIGQRSYRDIR